ncbi:MAG: 3-hydroxyacyl-CoA dehydrogenase family protein [Betaproteobacteria bacterium]|nr:3-hydroxyacyl-CoA dehydrogenase family protein [Betaproteobacteria bacterium]
MARQQSGVVIIGGGIMGGDIATIFAAGGWNVHVMSPSAKTRDALPARLNAGLAKLAADPANSALVRTYASLEAIPWQQVDLVIEAATEDLALKQQLFARIEALARPEIPLTSNTSTIPIGAIGQHLKTRSRVAGLHYFMPAHLVPLVEIIQAEHTDKAIVDWLEQNQKELGKAPVRVNKDIPGFLGNRLQHAMMREALYLIADGIVTPEGVDTAVRYGFGFRFLACGPMMQKEMSGWDTNFYAGSSVYPHLYAEKIPPQFLKDMVANGHIGMKTRRGLWEWTDESAAKEKTRIEKALQAALRILQADAT